MIENPNVICNECGFCKQNKILQQQLAIAVEALKYIGYGRLIIPSLPEIQNKALHALDKIKELEK